MYWSVVHFSLGLLALFITSTYADLPYNPSRALVLPPNSSHIAYFFIPTSSASSSFQLLALDASATIDGAGVPYTTLSPSLPFLQNDDSTAFTPIIDASGNLSVYAGKCSSNSAGSSLWTFNPNGTSGDWVEHHDGGDDTATNGTLSGANFLASGISFASSVGGSANDPVTYIFGGMCPDATPSTDVWTSSANYSNALLTLTAPSNQATTDFALSLSDAKGPPVAEAGFSITPLLPSLLQSSSSVQGQQQNFILLGGHTQTAFINTSSIAMLSLPEQSWTFMPVSSADTPITDLATRSGPVDVEPRSGHTAILTADGKKIIVFGGWVGDVDTPADPQLAVLEVGDGYGGTGSWQWDVPAQTGPTVPSGQGIYGHGAVMLPGDVMMIVGGYSISSSSNSKAKRDAQMSSSKTYFFNTTSNIWTTSYTHPASASQSSHSKSPAPSHSSRKAGIGAGVALGILALIALILLGLWCGRRTKRNHRVHREQGLRELSFTAQRFSSSDNLSYGIDGRGGEKSAMEWMGARSLNSQHDASPSHHRDDSGGSGGSDGVSGPVEAERTGLLVEIPSPTRGLRRSLHSRPRSGERLLSYNQVLNPQESRRSLAGSIHPIDERAEYEQPFSEGTTAADAEHSHTEGLASTASIADPFRDPQPLNSHPVLTAMGPSSPARERELEIQEWVTDWAAAEALIHRSASSATKDSQRSRDRRGHSPERNLGNVTKEADRTSSSLSEKSIPSSVSALSTLPASSFGTLSRSVSQRSAALFNAAGLSNPFASNSSSPSFDQPGGGGATPPSFRRSQNISQASRRESGGAASFATARTSFPMLQNEGQSLLAHGATPPGSPSKTRAPRIILGDSRPPATGWVSTIRRVLPRLGSSASTTLSVTNSSNASDRSSSPGVGAACPGPVIMRRTVGHGPVQGQDYWRGKRGAADWDAADIKSVGGGGGGGGSERSFGDQQGGAGEEWDVEAAVERRVVQVMFTVPKEKLRVVNGDGEETDLGSEDGDGDGEGLDRDRAKRATVG